MTTHKAFNYGGRLIYGLSRNGEVLFTDEHLGVAIGFQYPARAVSRIVVNHDLQHLARGAKLPELGLHLRVWDRKGVFRICLASGGDDAMRFLNWAARAVYAEGVA